MKIRLLLADEHRIFRETLQLLLLGVSDINVVGLAGSGAEVLELARATAPQVICMDIQMAGIDGMELTRNLHAELPGVKVVALSTHREQRYVMEMLQAGATGFVTKYDGCDELVHAIRAAAKGRTYLSSEVATLMAGDVTDRRTANSHNPISAREWQVLKLVADGRTSIEIAEVLSR